MGAETQNRPVKNKRQACIAQLEELHATISKNDKRRASQKTWNDTLTPWNTLNENKASGGAARDNLMFLANIHHCNGRAEDLQEFLKVLETATNNMFEHKSPAQRRSIGFALYQIKNKYPDFFKKIESHINKEFSKYLN